MDLELFETPSSPTLAEEAGKAFVISAVAAAGSLVGMFVVAYTVGLVSARREKRKKAQQAPLTKD